MNSHDSERIAGVLVERGMVPAVDSDQADVIVLNTCCIRENADNKLYGSLGRLKAIKDARPSLQIAVGGCLAQKDRERIVKRAPYVDVVFGTHNVGRIADLLDLAASSGGATVEILDAGTEDGRGTFAYSLPAVRENAHCSWVTIQVGCDNSCAFCIVPSVRGGEVSRPLDSIVAEVESLAAGGVSEVTLLGQNVNSYGRDITRRRPLFADLLRTVGAVDGIQRVRFTSPHPKDLRPETIEAMASVPQVCEHLHLPLQSGSDRILGLMHRGYTARRYLDRLAGARSLIGDLAVTTDVIVGFPGETEDDFEATLEVMVEAAYDGAYTFLFSPRPGTEAAAMTDRFVAPEVAATRFARLKVVVDRIALAAHEARVGRTEEVLVEGPSKRDPTVLSGRTRQNKLVHFSPRPRPMAKTGAGGRTGTSGSELAALPATGSIPQGSYVKVRIVRAAPHFLVGDIVEVLSRPRRRARLAVLAG